MFDPGLWKLVGTAMASIITTGVVAWFSFGASAVDYDTMTEYVATAITHEREVAAPFVSSMQEVQKEFNSFRVEQQGTNARLETLIEIMREK
jgi:hypothetical protein